MEDNTLYEIVERPVNMDYEMVNNSSYVTTKRDRSTINSNHGNNFKDGNVKPNADYDIDRHHQSCYSKLTVALLVVTCFSIFLAFCSLVIALFAVANSIKVQSQIDRLMQGRGENTGSQGQGGGIVEVQTSVRRLAQDFNSTQSQIGLLTVNVGELTVAQSSINEMIIEINGTRDNNMGPPGKEFENSYLKSILPIRLT